MRERRRGDSARPGAVGTGMTAQRPQGGPGRRRLMTSRRKVPVPHPAHPPDPPIPRDLLGRWARAGRTLPGRRDHEFNRLTAAPAWAGSTGWVSGTRARPGDGR
ncbi:hypothetical protein SCWH03_47770 [Streptomyces pacificus]|uniref:Uncharacterized protein n=1 Tax=Streptomyces pacificus TaxID=2705029 RepID=A0A6A0B1H3_9ACTN|nr:hypothetical protein SCWH03_47770 [Streptomyces pacificus]